MLAINEWLEYWPKLEPPEMPRNYANLSVLTVIVSDPISESREFNLHAVCVIGNMIDCPARMRNRNMLMLSVTILVLPILTRIMHSMYVVVTEFSASCQSFRNI